MADEDLLRRLRAALERDGSLPVDELVAAARDDAVAEARSILQALLTRTLLEKALAHLEGGQAPTAPPRPAPADAASAAPPEPAPTSAGSAWYVYAVQDAGAALPTLSGVGGAAVAGVEHEGLRALVSEVATDEFGQDAIAARMEDLGWLGEQASAHEAVVTAAFGDGPVVPLRFGTLYLSRDGVAGFLARHAAPLRTELERFSGRSEWSVKVLADADAIERWAAEHDPDAAASPDPDDVTEGHAYFARKRRRATLEAVRGRIVVGVAEDCHERLAALALDATSARPQQAELSGLPGEMVLNGAYLLDDDAVDAFRAAVEELAGVHGPRGFDLRLSGPWPPHHFIALPDVDGEPAASAEPR